MVTNFFMAIASSMFFIASWGFGTFRKIRKDRQGLVGIIGILVILIIGVACSDGEAVYEPDVGSTSQSLPSGGSSGQVLSAVDKHSSEEPESFSSAGSSGYTGGVFDSGGGVSGSSASPLIRSANSQAGIWVTGEGTISLEPDLAIVNIGVETEAKTVARARQIAATAMAAIVDSVKSYGLKDMDIQTRSFDIYPVYEYPEVVESGRTTYKQLLVGYRVNNSASIKVRQLDQVGNIIDDLATAGGDATRINGINFGVEDTKPFMVELREDAVKDVIEKATQFASLTGVSVGQLIFISEIGASAPAPQNFGGERAFALAAAAPPSTSISGGELELRLVVQAVFDIQ